MKDYCRTSFAFSSRLAFIFYVWSQEEAVGDSFGKMNPGGSQVEPITAADGHVDEVDNVVEPNQQQPGGVVPMGPGGQNVNAGGQQNPPGLVPNPMQGDGNDVERVETRKQSIQRCIESLTHACQCRDANCRLPSCRKMKRVIHHTKDCKRKTQGGCPICKQLIALCCYHAKHCQEDAKCLVPFCPNVKHRLKQQQLEQRLQQQQPMPVVNSTRVDAASSQPLVSSSASPLPGTSESTSSVEDLSLVEPNELGADGEEGTDPSGMSGTESIDAVESTGTGSGGRGGMCSVS